MASRNRKEEKAEGAARYAADEIKSAREERNSQDQLRRGDYDTGYGTGTGTGTGTYTTSSTVEEKNRPGIISSVVGALGSTYEHAKEAVTGKTHDAAEKTKETADSVSRSTQESHDAAAVRAREKAEWARAGRDNTAESLREAKDKTLGTAKDAAGYVGDKTREAKDKTVGTAKDAAGYVGDKTREAKDKTVEYKDYTADKAVEGKDATVGKLSELKDSAADAAKRAMGYFTVKKDEAKDKVSETAEMAKDKGFETKEEAKDMYRGTEDEARRKMAEERRLENLRNKGFNTVVDEDAALRGEAGKSTVFGAIGNMAEAVKSKLTMPHDVVEDEARRKAGEGREVKVTIEESPPGAAAEILRDANRTGRGVGVGAVADLLKDADQITGQSFSPNDVGRMDDDQGRTRRR
ncbi:uncharacterized protein LOC141641279 [Silene latifolia]|uniref:uncharacterized protein LOC141641279 n=1 Tax=Silene latifolia TaxID=37657 RepID=UPI003D7876CC